MHENNSARLRRDKLIRNNIGALSNNFSYRIDTTWEYFTGNTAKRDKKSIDYGSGTLSKYVVSRGFW